MQREGLAPMWHSRSHLDCQWGKPIAKQRQRQTHSSPSLQPTFVVTWHSHHWHTWSTWRLGNCRQLKKAWSIWSKALDFHLNTGHNMIFSQYNKWSGDMVVRYLFPQMLALILRMDGRQTPTWRQRLCCAIAQSRAKNYTPIWHCNKMYMAGLWCCNGYVII